MAENSNTPSDNQSTNLIRQFIITHYEPARDYLTAAVRLSTGQLFNKVTAMFPGSDLTVADLYLFLKDQEYIEVEVRPFQTEWLFQRKVS